MTLQSRSGFDHILLVITAALLLARLFQSSAALGENDRSRWATVRALGDHGTYRIGFREVNDNGYRDRGIIAEKGWTTIDKVMQPETLEFYSSKPPLLPTLVAALYWLLKHLIGLSITSHTWLVTRCLLVIVNVLPLMAYLILLNRLFAQLGRTSWGTTFLLACACFGTFITTFAVSLNNHTIAAMCVLFALYLALRIKDASERRPWGLYTASGLFAGLAISVELPTALFTAGLGLVLLRRNAGLALFAFAPAAAMPVAALLITNYLALGEVLPVQVMTPARWYEFEGAAWKNGIGEGMEGASQYESRIEYAMHLLEGHHGIFSLTPVFLLVVLPFVLPAPKVRSPEVADDSAQPVPPEPTPGQEASAQRTLRALGFATILLTLLLLLFYVFKTSNYGGVSCGPRWFFWLTPLFLVSMIPAADRLGASWPGRGLAYVFLGISVFSAHYRLLNPWTHPWIYDLMKFWGLIPY